MGVGSGVGWRPGVHSLPVGKIDIKRIVGGRPEERMKEPRELVWGGGLECRICVFRGLREGCYYAML